MRRSRDARDRREREAAQAIADQLAPTIRIEARAGEGGRLFGSVTSSDIAAAVQAQLGVEVDRRDIALDEPLKELGVARWPCSCTATSRRRCTSRSSRARRSPAPLGAAGLSTSCPQPPRGPQEAGAVLVENWRARAVALAPLGVSAVGHDPQCCGYATRFSTGKSHGCSSIDPQGERATFTSRPRRLASPPEPVACHRDIRLTVAREGEGAHLGPVARRRQTTTARRSRRAAPRCRPGAGRPDPSAQPRGRGVAARGDDAQPRGDHRRGRGAPRERPTSTSPRTASCSRPRSRCTRAASRSTR